jgi:hypothetical protein
MRRTPGFYRLASRIEDQMIRAAMPRISNADPIADPQQKPQPQVRPLTATLAEITAATV